MTRHRIRGSDFLSLAPLEGSELEDLLEEAMRLKHEGLKGIKPLGGKVIGLLFEKPSTRTRVSFEVAILKLGGHPLALGASESQLDRGETIEDTGRVLSRYLDGLVVRTFGQDRLEALAAAADVPVINALTDESHPCQALADMLTILEYKGSIAGVALAYVGDGNNVANSLMRAGTKLGMDVRVATPPEHRPMAGIVDECEAYAGRYGGTMKIVEDPAEAARGADVIYTDVWVSMGGEGGKPLSPDEFVPYRVDSELVSLAGDDVMVMHCLPAHRGMEITDDVLDGPHSAVWDQAENRLHAQVALLAGIYG